MTALEPGETAKANQKKRTGCYLLWQSIFKTEKKKKERKKIERNVLIGG